MTVKKINIILFNFTLIPIFYQIFTLRQFMVPYLQYIPLILLVLVGIPLSINRIGSLSKTNVLIIFPVLVNFIILPLVSLNLFRASISIEVSNMFLRLLCLLSILVLVAFINNNENLYRFLKCAILGNSIVLTVEIIINFKQLLIPSNYMWLSSVRLDRADYGFYHPNTTGLFLFTQIILLFLLYLKKKRKIIIPFIMFYTICLIPTGSRTALICLIIFFVLFLVIKAFMKFSIKLLPVTAVFVSIIAFLFLLNFNWQNLWENSSNRGYYFTHNLNYLMSTGMIWFGIAPVNNTNMSDVDPNILITDNWYLSNTILYGIVGTLIFICFLVTIFAKLVAKLLKQSTNTMIWGVCFILSFLIYNFFETLLFVPGELTSIIFWVFILSILKINTVEAENIIEQSKQKKKRKKFKKYRIVW